jgi:hypothetical protein
MLTHQLTLALHHTSIVLHHHPLEVLKITDLQCIGECIIQAIQKTVLLLLINIHFTWSIARQLSEVGDALVRRHGSLFQILELLLPQLDNPMGNMMCTASSSKLWPVDALRFLMGFHISFPLVGCKTRKLVRG